MYQHVGEFQKKRTEMCFLKNKLWWYPQQQALCHLWLHGRLFAQWFCPCGQCYPRDQSNHMAATVKVARQQTTPELSGAFRTLPPEPTPAYTGTLRNLPEPSGTCLRNLHHFTPELSGTFRNLPPELTPFYKELSGTFWNPPPEPTPAHSGTFRNLPEPSSGTCSCDPHRHTPELIWAEDPISLRCWGMMLFWKTNKFLFICFYENHYGNYTSIDPKQQRSFLEPPWPPFLFCPNLILCCSQVVLLNLPFHIVLNFCS